MKFILMMNTMRANQNPFPGWTKEDISRHIAYMIALHKELSANGELAGAEGLAMPEQAKLVRANKDGKPVTDGAFAETKEFLAGYWIVKVPTTERAYEIAAKASSAPGLNGEPMLMPIEVREIMAGPPPEFL